MSQFTRKIYNLTVLLGFDPLQFVQAVRNTPRFVQTALTFRQMSKGGTFPFHATQLFPILDDFDQPAGIASGYYFHQDLWASRKIFAVRPAEHVDIGSRIDGFVAHLLTFMPVKVIDIRPLTSPICGLTFVQGDATHLSMANSSIESLSSLHAVEHFGLGRYGDPVDPDACFGAMRELARVLKPHGRLYFSVPIGVERVYFNAHRVFAPHTILQTFKELELFSFSAVDDAGDFHENTDPDEFSYAHFACGLFEFSKKT